MTTAVTTVESLAEAVRLPVDVVEQTLHWLTAEPDWAADLVVAARWRDPMDTLADPRVQMSGDYLRDEPWWPLSGAFESAYVVATVVRNPGWVDAHL